MPATDGLDISGLAIVRDTVAVAVGGDFIVVQMTADEMRQFAVALCFAADQQEARAAADLAAAAPAGRA